MESCADFQNNPKGPLTSGQKRHLDGFLECMKLIEKNKPMPVLQNDEEKKMTKKLLVIPRDVKTGTNKDEPGLREKLQNAIKDGHFPSIKLADDFTTADQYEEVIVALIPIPSKTNPKNLIEWVRPRIWDDMCNFTPYVIEVSVLTNLVKQTEKARYLSAFPEDKIIIDIPMKHKKITNFTKYVGTFFERYFPQKSFPEFIIGGPYKTLTGTRLNHGDVSTGYVGYYHTPGSNGEQWEIGELLDKDIWNDEEESYYMHHTEEDQVLFAKDHVKYWEKVLKFVTMNPDDNDGDVDIDMTDIIEKKDNTDP